MEFKTYTEEEFEEKVMDWFSSRAKEPESLEPYTGAIEQAIQDMEEKYGLEIDFKVVIAETSIEKLETQFDEKIPRIAYTNGMGLSEELYEVDKDSVFLRTNKETDFWEGDLKSVAVHELAHLKFFENRELGSSIYEHILFEGHAMHIEKRIAKENNYETEFYHESKTDIDKEELKKDLDKKRSWNEPQSSEVSTIFKPEGEKWLNAEGYPIAYQITAQILDQEEIEIEQLLEYEKSEWRQKVDKAVEEIY